MHECRALFEKKLHDYGASWRILRPSSLTDQLFIKAKRIRSLEIKKESLVGDGIRPEFVALINYGIVGLIQLEKGFADTVDITNDEAMALYDRHANEAKPQRYMDGSHNLRRGMLHSFLGCKISHYLPYTKGRDITHIRI